MSLRSEFSLVLGLEGRWVKAGCGLDVPDFFRVQYCVLVWNGSMLGSDGGISVKQQGKAVVFY